MNTKSMQDQVLRLRREVIQLKAQNKQQTNYSMDLFDDTSNNSLKGIKRSSNTSTHKSQKQFSLSGNCHPKTVVPKKGRSSFSSVNGKNSKGGKGSYSYAPNSSKSTQLIKVPILKGMFSYKKSFIDDDKKSKFNLNSSMLSCDAKINFFDDNMIINNSNNTNDEGFGLGNNHMKYHQSSNSIDLSKYKIIGSRASSSVIGLSHTNSMVPMDQNAFESPLHQPLTQLNINKQMLSPSQGGGLNSTVIQNSMQLTSPVIINNINLQSNSNEMKASTVTTESFTYFKQRRKNERESRRMIIEIIKLKSKSTKEPIDSILSAMNISIKVLEQEKKAIKPPLQSNSIYSPYQSPQTNYHQKSSLLMMHQPNKTKSMSSLYQMHQFMSEMNDENKEKIKMINYLSIPRVMSLIINQSRQVPYIFVLSPNSICHLYGIETYVFKWREFKDGSNYGYFDLLKVVNCAKSKASPNQFKIQTEDTDSSESNSKTFEIEAASAEMSKNYVDCLSFLSQLIKCKAFKRIGHFSPPFN